MKRSGWFRDSYRHSLAARGIGSKYDYSLFAAKRKSEYCDLCGEDHPGGEAAHGKVRGKNGYTAMKAIDEESFVKIINGKAAALKKAGSGNWEGVDFTVYLPEQSWAGRTTVMVNQNGEVKLQNMYDGSEKTYSSVREMIASSGDNKYGLALHDNALYDSNVALDEG